MNQDNLIIQNDKIIKEMFERNIDIGEKLSDFEILQVLGEGGFGFVAKVKSKKNLKIYALKKIDLSKIKDLDYLKYYENEPILMKILNHPNVCKLYSSFRENTSIYLIMEFMNNGDLFTFLNTNQKLGKNINEEKLWNIFEQCLKGLVYIHSKGLIHRDIKPGNILINNEFQVKLTDFNTATFINKEKAMEFLNVQNLQNFINDGAQIGDKNFQAPEVINIEEEENNYYDDKIDVYSMGKTFCCLAFYQIEFPPNAYNIYSKELIDIIKRMLDPNRYTRPNSSQLYNYFIKEYVEKYIYISGLKSCINCLSLYSSLNNYFLTNGENIGPLNEISVQLNKIIQDLNLKNKNLYEYNLHNKSYNYLLYELRDLFYKNGLMKIGNGNNEIKPISIINFLLKKLHEELNTKKLNIGRNYLLKFIKRNDRKQEAYDNFMLFFNINFDSIISNNFFSLIKTKRICRECNSVDYLFNMFSFIPFNIKILTDQYPQKNDLNIYDAFICLNKNYLLLDKRKFITCQNCNNHTSHNEFKQFYNLPKNLIIIFDRGENNQYKYFINFDQKLNLSKYVESFYQKNNNVIYDLLGIICREELQYNNNDNKMKIREKYISFTLCKDDNLYLNSDNNQKYNLNQIKNIGNVIGLFYYCDYVEPNYVSNDIQNLIDKANLSNIFNINQNNQYIRINSQDNIYNENNMNNINLLNNNIFNQNNQFNNNNNFGNNEINQNNNYFNNGSNRINLININNPLYQNNGNNMLNMFNNNNNNIFNQNSNNINYYNNMNNNLFNRINMNYNNDQNIFLNNQINENNKFMNNKY